MSKQGKQVEATSSKILQHEWFLNTFRTQERTAELLKPELEAGNISYHDYASAVHFLPSIYPRLIPVSELICNIPFSQKNTDILLGGYGKQHNRIWSLRQETTLAHPKDHPLRLRYGFYVKRYRRDRCMAITRKMDVTIGESERV